MQPYAPGEGTDPGPVLRAMMQRRREEERSAQLEAADFAESFSERPTPLAAPEHPVQDVPHLPVCQTGGEEPNAQEPDSVDQLRAQLDVVRRVSVHKERTSTALLQRKDRQLATQLMREKTHVAKLRQHIAQLQKRVSSLMEAMGQELTVGQQQHVQGFGLLCQRLRDDTRLAALQQEQRRLVDDFTADIQLLIENSATTQKRRVGILGDDFKRQITDEFEHADPGSYGQTLPAPPQQGQLSDSLLSRDALEQSGCSEAPDAAADCSQALATALQRIEQLQAQNMQLRRELFQLKQREPLVSASREPTEAQEQDIVEPSLDIGDYRRVSSEVQSSPVRGLARWSPKQEGPDTCCSEEVDSSFNLLALPGFQPKGFGRDNSTAAAADRHQRRLSALSGVSSGAHSLRGSMNEAVMAGPDNSLSSSFFEDNGVPQVTSPQDSPYRVPTPPPGSPPPGSSASGGRPRDRSVPGPAGAVAHADRPRRNSHRLSDHRPRRRSVSVPLKDALGRSLGGSGKADASTQTTDSGNSVHRRSIKVHPADALSQVRTQSPAKAGANRCELSGALPPAKGDGEGRGHGDGRGHEDGGGDGAQNGHHAGAQTRRHTGERGRSPASPAVPRSPADSHPSLEPVGNGSPQHRRSVFDVPRPPPTSDSFPGGRPTRTPSRELHRVSSTCIGTDLPLLSSPGQGRPSAANAQSNARAAWLRIARDYSATVPATALSQLPQLRGQLATTPFGLRLRGAIEAACWADPRHVTFSAFAEVYASA
eukprot:TRINITY_DN970_c0_g1_i1.p1 TRINITY_DN970_c0_g1~~TRINITY_DN970_c0_g1_i1.p1  ORF type:complete len:790 (+),score=102.35 TRINITY_DN970_c0_g1_i1:78-2372(+)